MLQRQKNADMLRFLFDKGTTISQRDAKDTSFCLFFGELIGNAKQEDIPKVREILQILVDAGYKIPSHMEPLAYRELCALVRDDIELYKEFEKNGLRYDSANAANGLYNLLSTHSFNALAYFESKGCFEKTDHTKELRIWKWWDMDILEYCLNKGWKPGCVNGDCERELQLTALRNGIELWHGDVESICNSLDAEIIEACLKVGVHKVYPESAKKAGREDLLALYSKYGFDAFDETHDIIKGIIRGTFPLASLPEMIASDTRADWKK